MSLTILQFGTTGQVGLELIRQAAGRDIRLTALSRQQADFGDPEALAVAVREARPDLVIIAAAYTAVDQAETDEAVALAINAEAPGAIAAAATEVGAAVVFFSTDYVFGGDKGAAYLAGDTPRPLSAYGRTKLAGELAVLAANYRALVLRTSWVVSAHGRNFVRTMLRLAGEGNPIRVVDDQFGRPTSAADLARFVLDHAPRLVAASADDPAFGLHHFANAGETNWRRFAEGIFAEALGEDAPHVEPIATADRPAPARRPVRSTLDTRATEAVFDLHMRPWREALIEILADLQTEKANGA